MAIYSILLAVGLGVSAPWWGWRMARDGRYREGLSGRLGRVSAGLRESVRGKRVVWVHAVSVGEVLAAARLVGELEEALNGREQPHDNVRPAASGDRGAPWVVVVSTTTATGQTVARERFGAGRVFYFPLDFGWVVRRYLRTLRPELVVLVESELWPRLLGECERAGVPAAVVNARVSDRSFVRAMRVRRVWGWMGRKVGLWLAQGEESAGRLQQLGVEGERVRVSGNLKYDLKKGQLSEGARRIRSSRGASRVIVAGSTLEGEERMLLAAWPKILRGGPDFVMVVAPRHPERFDAVWREIEETGFKAARCSEWSKSDAGIEGGTVLLLDTIGDLATVYSTATVAFIGGSLVPKGGHNPLEAARYGKPIVMGKSFENFREIVEQMGTIRIITEDHLAEALVSSARNGKTNGRRGREFYESQAGATGRTVAALVELMGA